MSPTIQLKILGCTYLDVKVDMRAKDISAEMTYDSLNENGEGMLPRHCIVE